MNEYSFSYLKERHQFGSHVYFTDSEIKSLTVPDVPHDIMDSLTVKDPRKFVADNIPLKSEHSVNTDRVKTRSLGMSHIEGGWPKEVNAGEYEQTSKWRKRYEKDAQFADAVKDLCGKAKTIIEQNNTIDLYEEFFADVENAPTFVQDISVRTIAVFKDPVEESKGNRRTATFVTWSPETDKAQIATAYSITKFQHPGAAQMKKSSYIWDVASPNKPVTELAGPSPIVSLQYNTKATDLILGGMYNGMVGLFDTRRGSCNASSIANSHHDPVYSVNWLHSKTNSEFVSCSTDGQVLWWDTRNLSAPLHSKSIIEGDSEAKNGGATCLEWVQEAGPTKYLVGTESGIVINLNKKPKGSTDIGHKYGLDAGRHHGPVYALKRNHFLPKYFLTVGDWSAKIYCEDMKTPIIGSNYHEAMLQTGCWSPTRPGVFMVGRKDGVVDFWDYYYRQNEVAFSHKVSDGSIWSMAVRNDGRLLATGDSEGRVTVLDLSSYLYQPYGGVNQEKQAIFNTFEREYAREKNLDALKKSAAKKKAEDIAAAAKLSAAQQAGSAATGPILSNEVIAQIEDDFFKMIGRPRPQQQAPVAPTAAAAAASIASESYEEQDTDA